MARQDIDIGVSGNDGTGDSIRESFRKVNENFQELYAVFGIGGQISFTDLSDTPDNYEGQENKVPLVKSDGSGLALLELASDNSLDGSPDTIGFDFTVDGKVILKQLVSRVANDPEPTLAGPLNAATQPIANVTVNQAAIDTFNSVHGTDLTVSDLVINKSFADRNYQEKEVAGGGLRLGDEPADASGYTFTATDLELGNLEILNHGLSDAYIGAPFVFNSTGTDPFGVVTGGTYYLGIPDGDHISLYETAEDALDGTGRILLAGGSGTFTITDGGYDEDLEGFWLSNVAIPRKSAVRRQGDSMTGALNLFDHPGDLRGKGLPNGPDDLQAATKLYVDNAAATSTVNLYVSTAGSDSQEFTPDGKEGRNPAYAYRTINAAAQKAEEIILSAPPEPGPYQQTMTYGNGLGKSDVVTAGITSTISGRTNANALILQNKEWVAKEVTAYINTTYPSFAESYDIAICERDVQLILDAVRLDILLGNNANYLSRYAGLTYYSNASSAVAIGTQKAYTIAGIEYAKTLVRDYVLTNTAPPTLYQTRVEQYIEPAIVPDAAADSAAEAKFDTVIDVINDGPLQAPSIVDGTTTYKINISNGNYGFVDQANPENTDIIPGKVIRGKNSGAIGRIIDYRYESGPRAVSVVETDEVEIQLLKPIEFEEGEELEYGNYVVSTQISIRIESGIYEEDFPIRVPANVSIKGDEFRRVIIRPKKRVSQSRYANTFFYRDAVFDGLVLGNSAIESLEFEPQINSGRAAGTYTIPSNGYTAQYYGEGAEFEITVSASGAITDITVTNAGENWQANELITIDAADIGGVGYSFNVATVPNGKQYINPLTNEVDGYFGYHYLKKPGSLKNIGAGYTNVGKWETAALVLEDNREFIQEQVVNYTETTYPALLGVYSRATCFRDAGLIVDALVKDLRNGGNEFALEAQGEYYDGALPVDGSQDAETADAIQHIYTIAAQLIQGAAPSTLYGPSGAAPVRPDLPGANLVYDYDLFNGSAEPATWASGELYRVGNVVTFNFAGIDRYYQCRIENTSGSTFDATEIANYWTEIDGPDTVINNLVDTVTFAFDANYNPPLRNDQMDVFLMNDATILRNITGQGHGGFQMVLDPEGQVLTKSPYCQTGTGFAGSLNKQAFRGGLFVDAFVGNSAVQVTERVDGSAFRLRVQSLGSQADPQGLFVRRPQVPCAFYIDGRRFQVNAVTLYDPDFGTADLILDPSSNDGQGFTGLTSELSTGVDLDSIGTFEFNEEKCERDSNIIVNGVALDTVLGTNFNALYNGIAYRRGTASVVIDDQLAETTAAIAVGKTQTLALDSVAADSTATTRVGDAYDEVIDIITNGTTYTAEPGDGVVDALTFTDPGVDTNKLYARQILQLNRSLIATELTDWIATQVAGSIAPFTPSFTYDSVKCERDVRYIVDALSYDIQYGGNLGTKSAAESYVDGAVAQLPAGEQAATVAAYVQLKTIVGAMLDGSSAVVGYNNNAGNVASATEVTEAGDLIDIINTVITDGETSNMPADDTPDRTWADAALQSAYDEILQQQSLIVRRIVQSIAAPLPITLQTAGNRSILGNDFTQINDLGYGLVAVNGALSEMVSMFTYYCWTSYYSKNGSEIRSLTGSSCYGEYGLVAEGSDPNEIPDSVRLAEDMIQAAKVFDADVVLTLTDPYIIAAGEVLTQAGSTAYGTVSVDTADLGDSTVVTGGSRVIYLTGVVGAFDTTNQLTGDTLGALGAGSVPATVDSTGYGNNEENLFLYAYDFKDPPSNRSEFDVYHPGVPVIARYEVASAALAGHTVGEYVNVGTDITVVATTDDAFAAGALFNVQKTIANQYTATIENGGSSYTVNDTFLVSGADLGGVTPDNDCLIKVSEIDGTGGITAVTLQGNIWVEASTPYFNGRVFKLNFSTSDAQFSTNGLLEDTPFGELIQYRRNQTHVISDLARPDVLTIRPSTAVVFDENPGQIYRSISFLNSNSIGDELEDGYLQAGFDEGYDYIRMLVKSDKAQEVVGNVFDGTTPLTGGTEKGGTIGDVVLALQATLDSNEIFRLNNNLRTPEANRPIGWTQASLVEAPVFAWQGKKHYAFNARGVNDVTTELTLTASTQANPVNVTFNSDINLQSGEAVTFSDVVGMTELNGNTYYVDNIVVGVNVTADLYTDAALTATLDGTAFGAAGTDGTGSVTRETISPLAEDNEYVVVDIADYNTINQTDATGIYDPVLRGSLTVTLRAGLVEGATGDVTINISTCRATSHDFLDVGTGGFNDSNYPNVIFGEPAEKNQANEVDERGKGRVFYVSTDQNGIFRVGRFFSVDQGTGTVTFSASIALSDVDGLGFKRGVVVTEFSTDTAMTDNAADTVPTELAVRGYVNRRLGYDVNGNPVANKLGPGVLAPNGAVPMTDDLNAAGNTITNLATPTSDSDAATKSYVDDFLGNSDELKDLRSLTYNDDQVVEGQLIVATEYKKLIVDAGSIVSGPYERGDTITGTITGATGTVVDVIERIAVEGNIIEIIYEPLTGEFSDGKPIGSSPDPDVIAVLGGAEALCIDGPVDEWANGVMDPDSDITIDTNREVTVVGSEVTDRYTTINFQYAPGSIVNADVSATAAIAQSKLNLNAATTRSSAVGITQSDLGVASFDNDVFTATTGWITINNGQLPLQKIQRIQDGTVLGNWSGDSSDNDIDEVPFSTVISEGGGLSDADFEPSSLIASSSDPGEALIKTGAGTYGISNVSTTGEVNSIVKTDASGSIQVNSLILGGDPSYEVLSLDTTTLVFKTPAQGEILRAVGTAGAVTAGPDIEIPGSVNIGSTGVTESTLQNTSNFNGEPSLAVDWIYSSFIEAPGEKGSASTGIAIGANTGVTTLGQVAIVVADVATSSSFAPFIFDADGVLPDVDATYNIGSASLKYNEIFASLFRGTATEAYYADLAENYTADADYEPGTVLVFGGDAELTVTTDHGTHRVAGVVSTNPAHLMNAELEGEHVVALALQGRVPCKVLGKVQKGDLLVASAIPGYAIVNNTPAIGAVIGKALESKDDNDRGVIEIVVGKH